MNIESMGRRKKYILGMVLLVSGVLLIAVIHSYRSRVYVKCIFEAGTEIEATDFLKDITKEIAFTDDMGQIDTTIPGEYIVGLKSGIFTYNCTAVIRDTIAPKAEAVDVFFEEGQIIEPEQFVTNVEDITMVTAAYVQEPDYSIYGKQKVEVLLTDAGNNQITVSSHLITRVTVKELEAEAGTSFPDMSSFLLSNSEEASFVTLPETVDMNKVGDYPIDISANGMIDTTILHIKDTIAPVVEGKNHTAYTTDRVVCEDFIVSAADATNLTYEFVKEPNLTEAGEQSVSVVITDEGGNSVQKDMKLTVLKDTEPPVIVGAKDISIYVGSAISYKSGVNVTDNHDKDISLKVDNSQVQTNAIGTYPVIYSAADRAGNVVQEEINVTVMERPKPTEANVRPMVEAIVNNVITPDMSQWDKAYTLYHWCKKNIRYNGDGEDGTIWEAAYQAIEIGKGDCYIFSGTYAALLTVAGIENMLVYRVGGTTNHRWNLVNIGSGWYHCDSSPRGGGDSYICFMQTDAQVAAYTQSYTKKPNYYTFDGSKYPERATEIIF